MTDAARSARKDLREILTRALIKETGLDDAARRRIVNRVLRRAKPIIDVTPRAVVPSAHEAAPEDVLASNFDPYAIGAVVTLHRLGPEGLLTRLCEIESVDNLKRLGEAQNLCLPKGLDTADEVRLAIVTCAEQRLSERRAAAS